MQVCCGINKWSQLWKLIFNKNMKTKIITLVSSRKEGFVLTHSINGTDILQKTLQEDLGVIEF